MNNEGVTAAPMRALFESAPNGVAALDADGVMRLVNTPLARMFGHSVRALEGMPAAKLFPERQAGERAAMLRELDPGGAQQVRRQLAGLRRDGSEFPIEMVLTPFRAQPGMVMMVVIDDTERRKAEERQNLLIGELHHRTQNIFAVIQSVAMRTLSGERTLADARKVFLARLHAMSRTYTMLTEGAWEGARLERIVSDELAAISSQATVSGPAVMIQASAAQTFAMIVHELATNALKFGALSVPAGHVTVGWEVLPAPGGAELSFLWQERGGPPVIGPLHKGFGRSVLEDAARRLGRAEVTYAREGLRYTFATPLASVGWSLAPVKAP